jgi:predicted nucleotidyltransferase
MDWVLGNTILLTLKGSRAYGLDTQTSDTDVGGVVIPPQNIRNDLFHKFYQAENEKSIESALSHLKNPNNPKLESTIFSLEKFMQLAAAVNPNVIELLFVDDFLVLSKIGRVLVEHRDLFLSSRAYFTFFGYAYSQAAKIERHRKWLQKDISEPLRKDYGLTDVKNKNIDEIDRAIQSQINFWDFSTLPLDELAKNDLKEKIWDLIKSFKETDVGFDNWHHKYYFIALNKLSKELNLNEDIVSLIKREKQYKIDSEQWKSFLNWKKNRNPERAIVDSKHGYDTKHGCHLLRLSRMGLEILSTGKLLVKRPDAKELLSVKNGEWSYEKLMDEFISLERVAKKAYESTKLPRSVNYTQINELYHNLINLYETV